MYTLNILSVNKKMKTKEIEDFTYETIIDELYFRKKTLFNETSEEKRFVIACN